VLEFSIRGLNLHRLTFRPTQTRPTRNKYIDFYIYVVSLFVFKYRLSAFKCLRASYNSSMSITLSFSTGT